MTDTGYRGNDAENGNVTLAQNLLDVLANKTWGPTAVLQASLMRPGSGDGGEKVCRGHEIGYHMTIYNGKSLER